MISNFVMFSIPIMTLKYNTSGGTYRFGGQEWSFLWRWAQSGDGGAMGPPHPNEPRGQLDLERTLRWIFLLPVLMIRKSPLANGIRAKNLKSFVQRRCDQHDSGDWKGLIADYEGGVVAAQSVHLNDDRSESTKDEAKLHKAADLLARIQYSKACKYLQPNGLGDHADDAIVQ